MKVVLYGEGNTDVTIGSGDRRGALAILLSRVLDEGRGTFEIVGDRLPRLQQGAGYPRKVDLAIAKAHANGAEGVAIVVDRDGHVQRLGLLREGREQAQAKTTAPHAALAWQTALGVAIEMLEAWLIADTGVLSSIANAQGALSDPENIPNPKEHLNELLDEAELEVAETYDRIALEANLDEIQRRCPAFAAFVKEVKAVLLKES